MNAAALRRIGLLALAALALAGPARGAEDPAAAGERLLARRHYAEAIAALRPVAARPGAPARPLLALGVAYVRNAELHRALHRTAVAVRLDYLRRLSSERGSGLAGFSLGETLLAAGRPGEAAKYLEKYAAKAGRTPAGAFAGIDLALCRHRQGKTAEAKALFAAVDAADPEVGAELLGARARAGAPHAGGASAAAEALAALGRSGRKPSARALTGVALAYARAGQAEKGVDVIARADLAAFSREETLGKNKTIRFYDPFLLNDLATLYLSAGIAALERAASDPALRDAAEYALAEAYALSGNADASAKALDAVARSARLAAGYKDRAAARQAANRYAAGRKDDALRAWEDLARKGASDPDLLAEIVSACDRAGAPCDGIVGRAAAAADAGDGKRYRGLRFALGRHFLARGQYARALGHLEAARDKGNKNKIEANDPGLLADLAEGYYRTRNFPEAQEIHFELGKQFPAVRQIQDALQGIYAREQKSAGDVRIL